jgi:hypothetical protein
LNVTDAGTYECDVTVTPQDTTFISTGTTSNSRTISVSGMMDILSVVTIIIIMFPMQLFRFNLLMSLLKESPQLEPLTMQ